MQKEQQKGLSLIEVTLSIILLLLCISLGYGLFNNYLDNVNKYNVSQQIMVLIKNVKCYLATNSRDLPKPDAKNVIFLNNDFLSNHHLIEQGADNSSYFLQSMKVYIKPAVTEKDKEKLTYTILIVSQNNSKQRQMPDADIGAIATLLGQYGGYYDRKKNEFTGVNAAWKVSPEQWGIRSNKNMTVAAFDNVNIDRGNTASLTDLTAKFYSDGIEKNLQDIQTNGWRPKNQQDKLLLIWQGTNIARVNIKMILEDNNGEKQQEYDYSCYSTQNINQFSFYPLASWFSKSKVYQLIMEVVPVDKNNIQGQSYFIKGINLILSKA